MTRAYRNVCVSMSLAFALGATAVACTAENSLEAPAQVAPPAPTNAAGQPVLGENGARRNYGPAEWRVATEQASTLGWHRYVGDGGAIVGMHTFGASAPLKLLLEKFGFTPDAAAQVARECVAAAGATQGGIHEGHG